MGYTHYWKGEVKNDKGLKDALKILILRGIDEGVLDSDPDVSNITNKYLRFNGIGEDGHETFHLSFGKATDFDFCKTARKPYDKYVVGALSIVKKFSSDSFSWSSDGRAENHVEGQKLADDIVTKL